MNDVANLLERFSRGEISKEETISALYSMDNDNLGFACLDHARLQRRGGIETIYCAGKTKEQLCAICHSFQEHSNSIFGTRANQEQYEYVRREIPDLKYDPVSRVIFWTKEEKPVKFGNVAVCTGGTADIPIAEEAAQTAEFFHADVRRFYDIGVAGLHRLLSRINEIREAKAVIVVAGMEGALGSVIAGLVAVPVIAVPVSTGYGASFSGLAPLLSMLNSCAEGLSVVNIDNGFGAGYLAAQINRLATGNAVQDGNK